MQKIAHPFKVSVRITTRFLEGLLVGFYEDGAIAVSISDVLYRCKGNANQELEIDRDENDIEAIGLLLGQPPNISDFLRRPKGSGLTPEQLDGMFSDPD